MTPKKEFGIFSNPSQVFRMFFECKKWNSYQHNGFQRDNGYQHVLTEKTCSALSVIGIQNLKWRGPRPISNATSDFSVCINKLMLRYQDVNYRDVRESRVAQEKDACWNAYCWLSFTTNAQNLEIAIHLRLITSYWVRDIHCLNTPVDCNQSERCIFSFFIYLEFVDFLWEVLRFHCVMLSHEV